jgi:outer membrane protein
MTKKRQFLPTILFLSLLTFTSLGSVQQTSNVAVIDSQKTFQSSIAGKNAISQLQAKEQNIKNGLTRIDSQIQELETKLNVQKFTLKDEARQKIIFNLEKLKTERKRFEEDSTKEYQRLQFQLFSKVNSEVIPIIGNVAKEEGYVVVFELASSGVVYFDQAFDITEEVIKRYNALKTTK